VPTLAVTDLTVRLGSTLAVDGLTFGVESGEVVALLGPNGAGKTTAIETVEGFRDPTAGRVSVFGLDPRRQRSAVTERWGVMPQRGGLPTGLRVAEVVELYAALHRPPTDTAGLLELVGLGAHRRRPWRRLSGGEQQRLSLAAALVGRPELLLLDEPTAALDPLARQQVGALLRQRADDGVAVLLTTHLLDDVERHCDRILVLDHGRLVAAGTIDELTARTRSVSFTAPPGLAVEELARHLGAPVHRGASGRYRVETEPSPRVLADLTAWLAQHSITASEVSAGDRLEDVFLRLTADRSDSEGW
jgi:ABC-2 type transport system ATP-binding protein